MPFTGGRVIAVVSPIADVRSTRGESNRPINEMAPGNAARFNVVGHFWQRQKRGFRRVKSLADRLQYVMSIPNSKTSDQRLASVYGQSPAESASSAGRYLAIVTATITLTAACFAGILLVLDLAGSKPPPAFTNSHCIDEKLAFFRQNPPAHPTHLIVGSSIAWRNIATDVVAEEHPNTRPLNGAFCGLSFNQSAFAARFLLQRYPTITDVLVVIAPFDMGACRSNKTNLFDTADVSAYLSGANDLQFYFKYFDIFSLFVNTFGEKDVYTTHGDGPLNTDQPRRLVYGPAPAIQRECEAALAEFAAELTRNGKRLLVVTMPLLDEWSDKYDRDSKERVDFAAKIQRALNGSSATFWDAWSRITPAADGYIDATHLQWSAVPSFTRQLVAATGFGVRDR